MTVLHTPAPPTTRATPPATEPAPYPTRWRVLPVILSAMFMAMFDWFVVNVAASSLQHDLHAGQAALEMIIGGYGFAYASALITGGRLGDRYGYRILFVIGMLSFGIASLLCGSASGAWTLVAFRILQGGTAALMVPQLLALINTLFPVAERARAMAAFGATIGLGAVSGQVLGGVLLDADLFGWGWRAIFYVNVPIAVAAALAAARWLPAQRAPHRPSLDPIGALGIAAALAALLVPITVGRTQGWPLWTWVSMALSVPLLVLVLRYERRLAARGGQPVLDTAMIRERVFGAGMVVSGGYLAFFAGFMLCLTLLLQDGLHLTPLRAGLTFAPLGVCFATSSLVLARRVAARFGSRVIVIGTVTSCIGVGITLAVLLAAGSHIAAWELIPGMMIVGLGNGMTIPSALGAVLSSGIRPEQTGMAAGALTTAQQFNNAVGATVLGTVFFAVLGNAGGIGDFVTAMAAATAACLGILAVVLGAGWMLGQRAG